MIKNIIFDFDGTIVDSNEIKRFSFFKVTAQLGDVGNIVNEVLKSTKGDRTTIIETILKKCYKEGLVSSNINMDEMKKILIKEYNEMCEIEISRCNEIEEAKKTLSYLVNEGYSLFLNSSTPIINLFKIIELIELKSFFKNIYGNYGEKEKNFLKIKNDYNIVDDRSFLIVGDGEDDFQTAEKFHCTFVGLVQDQYQFSKDITYKIQNLKQLPGILTKIII